RTGRFAEIASANAGVHPFVSGDLRIATASRPALRRNDYLSEQTELVCAIGERIDAGPRGRAMGQGRLRGPRDRESRFVRPGHDVGDAGRARALSRARTATRSRA